MKKGKKLVHSEWRFSVMSLAALIGGVIGPSLVLREINLMVIYGYLAVFALVVAGNAVYVFFKRKKNNGTENENQEHG